MLMGPSDVILEFKTWYKGHKAIERCVNNRVLVRNNIV